MRGAFGKQLAGVDPAELAAAGRRLVEAEPMTFARLGQALAAQWPDHPPAALAQGVRTYVPLVQVPPRAVWGRAGQSMHTSAEHWLGRRRRSGEPAYPVPPASPAELAQLVTRYLGAFGPATVRDVQAWSGLTGLKAVLEQLRPSLVTFRDEQGAELFDLPTAPRPGEDTPAPVRLAAEFDNLVLSHAEQPRSHQPPLHRQRRHPGHGARGRVRGRDVAAGPDPGGRHGDHRDVRPGAGPRAGCADRRGEPGACVRSTGRGRLGQVRAAGHGLVTSARDRDDRYVPRAARHAHSGGQGKPKIFS
jgi:hypothetical protein